MNTDIMIDLETMGTDPYSPVVAIGAVRFKADDANTIGVPEDVFYQKISLESCMRAGLKPSAQTIIWWLTDPSVTQQARDETFGGEGLSLAMGLDAFTGWHNSGMETLWGNAAKFDLGLLEDAYRILDKPCAFTPWQQACYRGMKTLPAVKHIKLRRAGVHHNALDDALSQAHHLCEIVKHLGAYTPVNQPSIES